ncbi:MAG: two-component sensor histidine kinase, partial [Acetobacteraceae bacterium]|nr:two-component sensor histidine kinase [Acetobacteraceae bacterium]
DDAAAGRARREGEALRTALLTSLGHDLRTPLTAIRGAAETLRTSGDRLTGATRSDLLLTVEEEAERLSRWMGAILDLVRLEAGEVKPRREAVDLAGALDEARDAALRAHAGRRVAVETAPDLPRPPLDPALLGRILENLLDNALKYSAPDGAVRLSARREGARVLLAVEDDGPGIPGADLLRVFDPFFRAGRTDSVAAGSGLGLAICKGLVEAMGGRIAAESPVRDGRGTRMTLGFPT